MGDCILERHNNALIRAVAATLALLTGVVWGADAPSTSAKTLPGKVASVRFWSLGDVTRISIEVSSEFKVHTERLSNPDRVFFDIQGARPPFVDKALRVTPVGDSLLRQIRVAETQPGVTRVVLDLEPHTPAVAFTTSQLSNPDRLMIELKLAGSSNGSGPVSVSTNEKIAPPAAGAPSMPRTPAADLAPASSAAPTLLAKPAPRLFRPPPQETGALRPAPELPKLQILAPPPTLVASVKPPVLPGRAVVFNPPPSPEGEPLASVPAASTQAPSKSHAQPLPARTSAAGDRSLTRALGLKLGRIVIDAGHGGNDAGTRGPSGLLEKDVVLDVALKLGSMLQDRMGADIVYTRSDDTYIPLEERTRIANDRKADLFLSVHANSSPYRAVGGVETYYLNFTTSKTALDLAAKENAGAQSSIFDLKDVLAKIAMKDKIDESREFASTVQSSLFALANKNNAADKNRGIKQAPFVVLIGASMPSILAEIGFLTNATDEALLKKPEHREKIAEALYKGVAAYADSLSHFQVAQRQ